MKTFGIDLGTTNSCISTLLGIETRVFAPEACPDALLPSVIYCNEQGRLVVGEEARRRAVFDPENALQEFKREMGSRRMFDLGRSNKHLRPEDLGAELLRALCSLVKTQCSETVNQAVIAVPAGFDAPQCRATLEAARLAGIRECVLLNEPVAAAQAYSFLARTEKARWIIYDLGAGTFDVAIVGLRAGRIHVIKHRGDNELGGSNIDEDIVDAVLVPALGEPFTNEDKQAILRREERWKVVRAKLKEGAEQAKIRLSQSGQAAAPIEIDFLCTYPGGEVVSFDGALTAESLEKLARPIIARTLNDVDEVLKLARLDKSAIDKLILVGGSTRLPLVRRMAEEYGIAVDDTIDPMTVVARGAAIFAASHFEGRIRPDLNAESAEVGVELRFPAVSPYEENEIAGRFTFRNSSSPPEGCFLELTSEVGDSTWRSERTSVASNGGFRTLVKTQMGTENVYRIHLTSKTGTPIACSPDTFVIRSAGTALIQGSAVHNHNISVELEDDSVTVFYEAGLPLPFVSPSRKLRTTIGLSTGQSDRCVCVPICEGNRERASRNRRIGELIITSGMAPVDLPVGSEIEVRLEIDEQMNVTAAAWIPQFSYTDRSYVNLEIKLPDTTKLADMVGEAQTRLRQLLHRADLAQETGATILCKQIQEEDIVDELRRLIVAAPQDRSAARRCSNGLARLNGMLDDLEEVLSWPYLESQATGRIEQVRGTCNHHFCAVPADQLAFKAAQERVTDALRIRSSDRLDRALGELDHIEQTVLRRDPGAWHETFLDLKTKASKLADASGAMDYIARGNRAAAIGDIEDLKSAVRGLWSLVPEDQMASDKRKSTVGL